MGAKRRLEKLKIVTILKVRVIHMVGNQKAYPVHLRVLPSLFLRHLPLIKPVEFRTKSNFKRDSVECYNTQKTMTCLKASNVLTVLQTND